MTNAIFVSKSIKIVLAVQCSARTSKSPLLSGRFLLVLGFSLKPRVRISCARSLLPSSEDRQQVPQQLSLFRRECAEKILIHLVHLTIKRRLKVASASSECHPIHAAVGRMRLALDQSRLLQAIKQPGHGRAVELQALTQFGTTLMILFPEDLEQRVLHGGDTIRGQTLLGRLRDPLIRLAQIKA